MRAIATLERLDAGGLHPASRPAESQKKSQPTSGTFLAQRFQTTFEGPLGTGLQCAAANQGPVQTQKDANGVAISATITVNGQTQCFDTMGNKVAMTICMNNANAVAHATNNNGHGMNQQAQGQPCPQATSTLQTTESN